MAVKTLGNNSYAWWVGTDGNIWANIGGVGVRQLPGQVNADGTATIMSYADTGMPSDYLTADKRIADPVNGGGGNNTSVTATAPVKRVNQAGVDATQQAIDSLGTEQSVGNQNIDASYGSLINKYDVDRGRNEADYNENVVTNNTNLEKNTQNAYVSAAQGRRGLRGTLAAIGALSGDGGVLADRAVTEEANRDIGGARDTATTNDAALGKAIGRYREEDDSRRKEAETSRNNQKTALEGNILSKRQQFLQKMAELYAEGGDDGRAAQLLGEAGGLNQGIAQRTAVQATPFSERKAAFAPGELENYLAGANDMTVRVADGGEGANTVLAGGDPALALRKKKDREDAVAAVAA